LGAQDHQDIPFEQVVELVQPARSRAHTPLFQVMFTWQNAPQGGLRLPGLTLASAGPAAHTTAKFDLALTLQEAGGRIAGSVTYATSLFSEATVERYLGYLRRVLQAMAADETLTLDRLPLLPADERARMVEEWNATGAEYPVESCIHELFEAQVERTPGAIAVVHEDVGLTYAELNARANRLAHHLRERGVGPDSRVAVCVERGLEMAVGLMAVLKAGGAYVPLDPAYPHDRLRYMLRSSAPIALLTQSRLAGLMDSLADGLDVPVMHLDGGAAEWAGQPETNPERGELTPDHLMYVIYTSGSTGLPKGVMNQHRCVVNRLAWGQRTWELQPGESVLQNASFSFDVSVRELFWPLMAGGRVVMLPPEGARDPGCLVETIRRERVRVACFVPSMLQIFLEHPDAEHCTGLRRVVCSGEALPAAVARRFHERLPGVALDNVYGPSEAATALASPGCRADDSRGTVPIGRPISNTRVYVLDAAGEPVPAGVTGELFIGGAGVARGYLDRPDLTAERFVADPFSGEPGARLYRTGDLARWLPDGTVEFLGRNDFQVKLRGFRIELGEIEARLAQHAAVREAVVLVREDVPGDERLVAYYLAAEAVETDALRAYLSANLPEYMVPAAFVWMEAMPLTPNGKTDRKALPAPEGGAFGAREYEAPVGAVETALAGIWAEVLGVEQVGRQDSFFELGGHSLRAVRVVSRVRQDLGIEVALGDLFLRPVLADFARGLETAARADLPAIVQAERGERVALSFAQQRLWFLERMGELGATYHMPTRLRLKGVLDRAALGRALDRIVARHEALRTVFAEVDGEPVQVITPAEDSRFALLDFDLSGHAEPETELRRVMAGESAPFDLAQGPLVRGRLVRMGEDDHVLAVTMHHIVSDGWSMGVLTHELSSLYGAFLRGEADPLPALPVQYADYAAWQRKWVDGDILQQQADYWKTTLAGAPDVLELPADRPRPARPDHAGAAVGLVLDEELTAGLKALSQRHGTTLYMTLLAGWAAVLGRLANQTDVVIGTPTANRGRREIEGLIGFFVNTLALRMDLADASVAELLGQVKERTLGAQQHQDIPFEQVVDLVQPARSMSHTPLFQVLFAWQNAGQGGLELPGLTLASAGAAANVTAKFDLSLTLQEAGDRIVGGVEYATSLFERGTIERYLGYLRLVLQAMAADELQSVARLPLLPAAERTQVVETFNATTADFPADTSVHALFEAQAERTPGAIAVVHEDVELTYAELNARANRLAHHLRERGVGPDTRVAVLVPRSAELVIAELAVLKAGAAYVPVDPAFPAERIAFMVADSASPVVLGRTADDLPELGVERIDVDALPEGATGNPCVPVDGGAAAYVMYTSGSTGAPKGVVVPHRAIARLVINNGYARFGAEDRVAFAANPAFDATTMEVWAPLLNGGRVVVIDQDTLLDPRRFCEALLTYGVDVLWLTVGLFNQYVEDLKPALPRLRYLIVGGDALDPRIIARVLEGHAPKHLLNGYGPTETTTFAITHEITSVAEGARSIPLGRPIANTQIYILDGQGAPVPVGVAGEIHIGGAGVALGYLNQPELTAGRFI
ncbi:MAG TPA: amino acid adenylation domain-containing protein, partial [Longimicrobium sp.]